MQRLIPWQALVALIGLYWVAYGVFAVAAVACVFLSWPYFGVVFLFLALLTLAFLIPLSLNFGRHLFRPLLLAHAAHQIGAIFIFAGYFFNIGLRDSAGKISTSFLDAIYFSIATWTTLGASDFSVPEAYRLLVAFEALTAIISIPVFTSLSWLLLQELTVPPEQSYLAKISRRRTHATGPKDESAI